MVYTGMLLFFIDITRFVCDLFPCGVCGRVLCYFVFVVGFLFKFNELRCMLFFETQRL